MTAVLSRRRLTAVHWASLAVAGVFLLWAARDQWFDSDEWDFLANRRLIGSSTHTGIWDPHNRHWTTLGVLFYRLLYSVFGVRTYVPYLVVLIVVHLAVAHLLWRMMLRFRVDPLFATVAAGVFALAGAGWENLGNAFQITLIGSLGTGLAAYALTLAADLRAPRVAAVWLLLLASLMFSGVGIAMVMIVVAGVLLRAGLRAAVVVGSAPTALYLVWYLLHGRNSPPGAGEQGAWPALQAVPAFVWRGLTSAIDVETGLEGIGVVLLVLLGWWLIRSFDLADDGWRESVVLALGAVLFLAITAFGRSGLGLATAASSRYSYVTLALLLPVATLAADRLLTRSPAREITLGVVSALLVLVSVSTVARNADAAGLREQEQKQRVLAASTLVRAGDRFVDRIVVPVYLPDLDTDGIRELLSDGAWPPLDVTADDVLTAREWLQLGIGDDPIRPAGAAPRLGTVTGADIVAGDRDDCVRVVPRSDTPRIELDFDQPGSASLRSERSGAINARLRNGAGAAPSGDDSSGDAVGRARSFAVPSDTTQHLAVSHPNLVLELELVPDGHTTVCGVRRSGV